MCVEVFLSPNYYRAIFYISWYFSQPATQPSHLKGIQRPAINFQWNEVICKKIKLPLRYGLISTPFKKKPHTQELPTVSASGRVGLQEVLRAQCHLDLRWPASHQTLSGSAYSLALIEIQVTAFQSLKWLAVGSSALHCSKSIPGPYCRREGFTWSSCVKNSSCP